MKKSDYTLFWASVLSLLVLSASFLLMPVNSSENPAETSVWSVFAGILFWLSIISTAIAQSVLTSRRNKAYRENKIRQTRVQKTVGVFSFFRNFYGTISDVTFVLSIIALVVSIILTDAAGYLCYVFVGTSVFTFSMHCVFNGKNYYYLININSLIKSSEKERYSKSVKSEE